MALRVAPLRLSAADQRRVKPPPKTADPELGIADHKAWRNEVKRRAGYRCEWAGCGVTQPKMYADHIRERRDGGDPLDVKNGQCLCARHHSMKTAASRAARR